MRELLRELYSMLKERDKELRFILITEITKSTKMGVFSALNNLNDVSFDDRYAQMFGYTRSVFCEANFTNCFCQGRISIAIIIHLNTSINTLSRDRLSGLVSCNSSFLTRETVSLKLVIISS